MRTFVVGIVVLAFVGLISLAIGTKGIAPGDVVRVLLHDDGSDAAAVVRDVRVPRLLVGLAVGVALGLAGALMQALTRNPLADPGLLGIDAGAAAAIVIAIAVLHLANPTEYVWFAFAGAAAASVVVYLLGSSGRAGATPVRLALAGICVAAALTAFTNGVTLLDPLAFNDFRFWSVGALAGRDLSVLAAVGPFLAAG